MAGNHLSKRDGVTDVGTDTIWIDLLNPTEKEETDIEKALGLDVPTRAEMREIEASNRFYGEDGAHFMTAFVLYAVDRETVATSNITFILAGDRLITVRYGEPRAFSIYADKACKMSEGCRTGAQVLAGLLETIIQRQADLIERLQDEVETLAPQIFGQPNTDRKQGRRLDVMLRAVGKQGDTTSRTLESATSLHRTLAFFAAAARERNEDAKLLARIDSSDRDILSLSEQLRFVTGRTNFLLDATLGMISTEQNQIIKLFSVMAVMLMPPTLVASIYGMNFQYMPEIHFTYGYPLALLLMIVSGLIPFFYFRHKGWL
ncbi:MAG TPA: magnesium transporter CorA family protein [Hyphomicrobium sp.]|nr:magnesium transporter CorA family protein [Hyphomicrobium sp.]